MSDMRNDGFPSKKSKGLGLKIFVALAFVSIVVAAIVVVPKTTFFQGSTISLTHQAIYEDVRDLGAQDLIIEKAVELDTIQQDSATATVYLNTLKRSVSTEIEAKAALVELDKIASESKDSGILETIKADQYEVSKAFPMLDIKDAPLDNVAKDAPLDTVIKDAPLDTVIKDAPLDTVVKDVKF